ncbi:MAG: flagellar export protein FliJ [Brevundimonas sp.]
MTAWAQSLIRISNYEVETLQKRLAEITARRATAEMRLAVLDAEVEIERERARMDADAGMMLAAYLNGWKARKAAAEGDLTVVDAEEAGARDALTGAFEELKKFEHVAETTRLNTLLAIAKRETAAFDELGLRKRAV